MIYIYDTKCCAVMEITQLSSEPNAKTAMKNFIEAEMFDGYGGYEDNETPIPYSFYTFTGVVKHTDGTRPTQNGKYGPNFAALIRRNKLGKLTQSVMRSNRVNHPSHYVRIWTWAPSVRNCKKWYKREFRG